MVSQQVFTLLVSGSSPGRSTIVKSLVLETHVTDAFYRVPSLVYKILNYGNVGGW